MLAYSGNHTSVHEAAREIFNGRHKKYFHDAGGKFDAKKDILLHAGDDCDLGSFYHDELQEEVEDYEQAG